MTDKTTKSLLGFYGFFRRIFNPFKFPTTELWKSKVNLPLGAFVNEVMKMAYKPDKLDGLLDWNDSLDTFWDEKKEHGRDCDDFSAAYIWWGINNGYDVTEYVVVSNESKNLFKAISKTSHYVCVLHKDDDYILMNYYSYGLFKSEKEAIEYMSKFSTYKHNLVYAKVREIQHL